MQAVSAMLKGLDKGAYILPNAVPSNNVLVACCAGPALLSLPAALLAMLLAPLMVLHGSTCPIIKLLRD